MLPPFCFTNDLASATVGQGKIAYDGVEVLRSQKCKGAFHIVGGGNGMTEVPEQASQDTAGIAVVFDHQYLQGHKSGKTSRGYDCLACYHNRNNRAGWLFRRQENFIPVSSASGRLNSCSSERLRILRRA